MIRLEALVLAIGKSNGAFDDPETTAFQLCNPLLLKTWRPEKKCDSDHYRIFSSIMGGFKAGLAAVQAKCNGQTNHLSSENPLRDVLALFGFKHEINTRKLILFLRRALKDETISLNTPIGWFFEMPEVPKSVPEVGE